MTEVRHPLVAPEGWKFIFLGLVLSLFSLKYGEWFLSLLCVFFLICSFLLFRDPYREIPSLPLAVLCPVDGVVSELSKQEEGLLLRESIKLVIRIHKSGAYTTRSPTEGKIMSLSDAEAGSRVIDTGGLWVRTDENDDVVLLMKGTGPLGAYPAIAEVRYGERIGQGERVGVNRLAQTAELYLPINANIKIKKGDKVTAAETVIAEYVRSNADEEE